MWEDAGCLLISLWSICRKMGYIGYMNNPVKTRRLILSFRYSIWMPQRAPTQKISPLKTTLTPKPFAKFIYPGFLGVFGPQFFSPPFLHPNPMGPSERIGDKEELAWSGRRGRSPYFSRFSPPYILRSWEDPLHVGIGFTLERIRIFRISPSLLALDFQEETSLSRWAKSKPLCQCQKRRGVVTVVREPPEIPNKTWSWMTKTAFLRRQCDDNSWWW